MTDLFEPAYTPAEMLRAGVFGGAYFADATDADLEGLSDDVLALVPENRSPRRRAPHNRFNSLAGMSYAEWAAKGWIFPEDPLGWFHWYCRWHNGRRCMRDPHQMRRWIGQGKNWSRFMKGDASWPPSMTMHQSLLQWCYDPDAVFSQYAEQNGLPETNLSPIQ